jgi:hypothetical protein
VNAKKAHAPRPRGWPDPQALIADAKRGSIDDRTAYLSTEDLEELARLADARPQYRPMAAVPAPHTTRKAAANEVAPQRTRRKARQPSNPAGSRSAPA